MNINLELANMGLSSNQDIFFQAVALSLYEVPVDKCIVKKLKKAAKHMDCVSNEITYSLMRDGQISQRSVRFLLEGLRNDIDKILDSINGEISDEV